MRVSVAFACLILAACARETPERPRARDARRAELPLPETAFTGPESDASAASAASGDDRFVTRRIANGPRYGGAPIDLDVKGADLHDVFRLIADVGKVSIVVAGDVSGTITLKLSRVPWDQALEVVAKAKGLAVERDGNVVIVRAQ